MYACERPPGRPGSRFASWSSWVSASKGAILQVVENITKKAANEVNWHGLSRTVSEPLIDKFSTRFGGPEIPLLRRRGSRDGFLTEQQNVCDGEKQTLQYEHRGG